MGGRLSSQQVVVSGHVEPGYETVRDMFTKNFVDGREKDAQLCVYVGSRKVIDLWGSADGDESYTGDSLQCIFSSSKAVTAIALASIAQRGILDFSKPVAHYWPEFGQNGKDTVRVEDLLRHEGGMAHLHASVNGKDLFTRNLCNGNVAKLIASDYQVFPEKSPREYHNLTAGWVANEVFRRVSPGSVTIGTWLRSNVCGPLGADCYLGLTDDEMPRVRPLSALSTNAALFESLLPSALGSKVDYNFLIFSKVLKNFRARFVETQSRGYAPAFEVQDPGMDPSDFVATFCNSKLWREGESPHGNMHASARGLAKLAAAMANGGTFDGVQVLNQIGHRMLHENPVVREDASMKGCRTEFTQAGVNVFRDYSDDIVGERIFKSGRHGFVGWLGLGGSVLQWNISHKIGFGYACTLVTWWDLANTKARKLQKEVVRCTVALENDKEAPVDENNNPQLVVNVVSS